LDWRQVFAPQLRLWRAAILMGLGVWAFQLGMNSLEFWRDAAAIVRLVILAILGAVLYAALVRNELRQCFAVGTSGRNSPPGDSS
jgi:hypothetical protein